MSQKITSGIAKKVRKSDIQEEKSIIGIRIPKVRLTSLGRSTISLPSPPRMLVLMATYIFLFWLMAGGIYIMVRNPIALGSKQGGTQPIYFYPSLNDSFIIEGFIAAIILFVGGIGAIMIYQASLQAYNKSYALKLLYLGLVLSGVAFLIMQWMINIKLGKM
ncbi:MAG: hypothetical protein ACTSVI_07700 [Promethearchaeota archaeon]